MAEFIAVFCDDIRQEFNGKLMLIGVYGTDIVMQDVPALVPLSVWLRLKNVAAGTHKFDFTLAPPIGDQRIQMNGQLEIANEESVVNLSFVGMPVPVEGVGEIVANLSLDGAPEFELGRLRVVVGAPPAGR